MNIFPTPLVKKLCVKTHNLVFHGGWNMPSAIGIELSTACNRRCWYCPQSINPHKQSIIKPEVWDKFLFRLKELQWRGMVGFHNYNEPTLVQRFPSYVAQLKNSVPHCKPLLFSNGDRPEVIHEALQCGLFLAIVTEHPPLKPGWREALEPLQRKWGWRLRVAKLPESQMHSHGGVIEKIKTPPMTKCTEFVGGMSVGITGEMALCCIDYEHDHGIQFGNIFDHSIKELWYSQVALNVRRKLANGEPASKLCYGCFQLPIPA